MRIYFDTCCYSRPFDDERQYRYRMEEAAIADIVGMCRENGYVILGSRAVVWEINRTGNRKTRKKIMNVYEKTITNTAECDGDTLKRIRTLANKAGVRGIDKTHLACAVAENADYLITTDVRFEEACSTMKLSVRVINPLKFPLRRYGVIAAAEPLEVREPGLAVMSPSMFVFDGITDPNEIYEAGTPEFKELQERALAFIENERQRQRIREAWGDDYIGFGDFTEELQNRPELTDDELDGLHEIFQIGWIIARLTGTENYGTANEKQFYDDEDEIIWKGMQKTELAQTTLKEYLNGQHAWWLGHITLGEVAEGLEKWKRGEEIKPIKIAG